MLVSYQSGAPTCNNNLTPYRQYLSPTMYTDGRVHRTTWLGVHRVLSSIIITPPMDKDFATAASSAYNRERHRWIWSSPIYLLGGCVRRRSVRHRHVGEGLYIWCHRWNCVRYNSGREALKVLLLLLAGGWDPLGVTYSRYLSNREVPMYPWESLDRYL